MNNKKYRKIIIFIPILLLILFITTYIINYGISYNNVSSITADFFVQENQISEASVKDKQSNENTELSHSDINETNHSLNFISSKPVLFNTVANYPQITFEEKEYRLKVGSETSINSTSDPQNVTVVYRTDNSKVITFQNNIVTAKSVGTANILAYVNNNLVGFCPVIVSEEPPVGITITAVSEDLNIKVNKSLQLSATVTPSIEQENLQYTSSNNNICTVDNKGKITGVAQGIATIVISHPNAISKSVTVNVREDESIDLSTTNLYAIKDTINIQEGNSVFAGIICTPSRNRSGITYESSNTAIASINTSGQIIAKTQGMTTITARCNGKIKTITVNVYNDPEFELPQNIALFINSVGQLRYSYEDTVFDSSDIELISGDSSICSIDASGVYTGRARGVTTITIRTPLGDKKINVMVAPTSIADPAGDTKPDGNNNTGGATNPGTTTPGGITPPINDNTPTEASFSLTGNTTIFTANQDIATDASKVVTCSVKCEMIFSIISGQDIATITDKGIITASKEGTVTIKVSDKTNGIKPITFQIKFYKPELEYDEITASLTSESDTSINDGKIITHSDNSFTVKLSGFKSDNANLEMSELIDKYITPVYDSKYLKYKGNGTFKAVHPGLTKIDFYVDSSKKLAMSIPVKIEYEDIYFTESRSKIIARTSRQLILKFNKYIDPKSIDKNIFLSRSENGDHEKLNISLKNNLIYIKPLGDISGTYFIYITDYLLDSKGNQLAFPMRIEIQFKK